MIRYYKFFSGFQNGTKKKKKKNEGLQIGADFRDYKSGQEGLQIGAAFVQSALFDSTKNFFFLVTID